MKKQSTKLLTELLGEIEQKQALCEKILKCKTFLDTFEEVFPHADMSIWTNEIDIWLPFDFEMISQVREYMLIQWNRANPEENRYFSGSTGVHKLVYRDFLGFRFEFLFATNRDGTTCILNKIGEEEIPASMKPIYEVICTKGAEEGSF